MKNEPSKLIFLSIVILILCGGFFVLHIREVKREKVLAEAEFLKIEKEKKRFEVFQNLNLEAKSVYVYDINTGKVLFAKNENEIKGIASLTKIITALVALDKLNPTNPITISKSASDAYGDIGFSAGDSWFLNDLLALMLTASSNDAATAIEESVFALSPAQNLVSLMNERSSSLGFSSLMFKNATGLDNGADIQARGSAKDIAHLMAFAFKNYPEIFSDTSKSVLSKRSMDGKSIIISNTNPLAGGELNIVASKTGYTDFAGGSLALITEPKTGQPIAIAILGGTFDGRFKDGDTILRATREYVFSE